MLAKNRHRTFNNRLTEDNEDDLENCRQTDARQECNLPAPSGRAEGGHRRRHADQRATAGKVHSQRLTGLRGMITGAWLLVLYIVRTLTIINDILAGEIKHNSTFRQNFTKIDIYIPKAHQALHEDSLALRNY